MENGELRLESFVPGPHEGSHLGEHVRVSANGPMSHPAHEWNVVPRRSELVDHLGLSVGRRTDGEVRRRSGLRRLRGPRGHTTFDASLAATGWRWLPNIPV